MHISRRGVLRLAAGGISAAGSGLALAQDSQRTFDESYRSITPQPTIAADKIEIIDFFWYGCPYCYQLLPLLQAWEKSKPADVIMRRFPAVLRQEWVPDAHLYYTLDLLGEAERLHAKVFDGVHRDHMYSTDSEAWGKWAVVNGIERTKWDAAYNSQGVRDKVVQAVDVARDYDVRGTPAIIVDGRYQTSGGYAGSIKNVMPTVDGLINLVRERRKRA